MQWRNTVSGYGSVSRFLHWIIAAGILVQWLLAEAGEDSESVSVVTGLDAMTLHRSIGWTILGLALVRLSWRVLGTRPAWPSRMKPYEIVLARAVHGAFYVLLFAIPLTGWALSSAEGDPLRFFNLFEVPAIAAGNDETFEDVHEVLFNALVLLVVVHVLAAVKHRFVDRLRDKTRVAT